MTDADVIARALALLGKRSLVLSLHDPCFPSAPGQDIGRGSPYTRGGRAFLEFAAGLGFTGIQLGPQGLTTASNPSPYDSTIFARNTLSIDPFALADDPQWLGLVRPRALDRLLAAAEPGRRVHHRHVHAAMTDMLADAADALLARRAAQTDSATCALISRLDSFTTTQADWLAPAGLYAALAARHGDDWRAWPDPLDRHLYSPAPHEQTACADRRAALRRAHAPALAAFTAQQFIAHAQHDELRVHTRRLGLKLYGDLQIGTSLQDLWAYRALFLSDYRMGAPPSRTNPDGQPWSYPVLDPDQYHVGADPGPVLKFMFARVDKLLAEHDGLRIDHPHGLICPWVYRADAPDPLRAVQTGARLFAAPDLPGHPALARYALVRRDQLSPDPTTPRHADDWVRDLTDAQVDAYGTLLEVILAAAAGHGRDRGDLLCEVLSTQPYPLYRVMQRHALGRFRVTQKADLDRPADVYRSENAAPADWIMVGNHDTPTIWALTARWQQTNTAAVQARYLAARLAPAETDVAALAAELAADPHRLAQAKFADIFTSPAEHVLIFFADLLGYHDAYNVPGTVDDTNWSLRIPSDYQDRYAAARRTGEALDLPRILAMALRRAAQPDAPELAEVLAALDRIAMPA